MQNKAGLSEQVAGNHTVDTSANTRVEDTDIPKCCRRLCMSQRAAPERMLFCLPHGTNGRKERQLGRTAVQALHDM